MGESDLESTKMEQWGWGKMINTQLDEFQWVFFTLSMFFLFFLYCWFIRRKVKALESSWS